MPITIAVSFPLGHVVTYTDKLGYTQWLTISVPARKKTDMSLYYKKLQEKQGRQ
jgi:hypothetical protein